MTEARPEADVCYHGHMEPTRFGTAPATVILTSLVVGLVVGPTAAYAQKGLSFALHAGRLFPHGGFAAFEPGPSFGFDAEIPLGREFAIGMLLAADHPQGGPKLIAANRPPDANDISVFSVLPFARVYGPGTGLRPFAFAGLGYAALSGQIAQRDTFGIDSVFPAAAVGGGARLWITTTLAVELTYRLHAVRAKGTTYTHSAVALGGRFRFPYAR